jgi:hypothetical protein
VETLKARGLKLTGPKGGAMRYVEGETPKIMQLKTVFEKAIAAAEEAGNTERTKQLREIWDIMNEPPEPITQEEIDAFAQKIVEATTVDQLPTDDEIKGLIARGLNRSAKVKNSEGDEESIFQFIILLCDTKSNSPMDGRLRKIARSIPQ